MENNRENSIDAVIYDGIRFLESMTKHYGPEKGMELWNSMGEAMGREVKGKIFFAMVTGATTGKVKFAADLAVSNNNAIPVIKAIRAYTKLSLKESKDLWDQSRISLVTVEVDPYRQRELVTDLKELGCRVL